MPYLIVENGPLKGHRAELKPGGSLLFGRDKRADIQTDDTLCSRRHFAVEARKNAFVLKDLGSSNGTFVNDRRIEEVTLTSGDTIRAGDTQITFLDDAAATGKGLQGKEVGGYRLRERIGRGGMGTVYKAVQVSLNREVALKILSTRYSRNPEFVKRFQKEAQAAGRLNHPNVVQVYDVGNDRDLYFYSMEYIENGSVQDLVNREGRLDPELVLSIISDAARGLEYAERKGLVHRDIKPDNLMINAEGVVKIADLGLAHDVRDLEGKEHPADEGIFGTPHFISPEQARGEKVDTRSDIYSLGATTYFLLTGHPPFAGKNVREIIQKQILEDPPPLKDEVKGCPPLLIQAIEKMMRKDPAERFQSAAELVETLERIGRDMERKPRSVLLVGIILLLLLGGAGGLLYVLGDTDEPESPPRPSPESGPPNAETSDPALIAERERLAREKRESDANEAFLAARIEELKIKEGKRTLEALRHVRDLYVRDVLEAFPDTEAHSKAQAAVARLDEEIAALEESEARRREEETRARAAAEKAVTLALQTAGRQAQEGHSCAALASLREALQSPALKGRPEAAALEKKREEILEAARRSARDTVTKAKAFQAENRFEEAAALLRRFADTLVADCPENLRHQDLVSLAEDLRTRADKALAARRQRRIADLEHDQRVGFAARRQAVLDLRKAFDPPGVRRRLEQVRKEIRTPEWQALIAEDLRDLEACETVLAAVRRELAKKVGQKIYLPSSSKPSKGIRYTLVSVDDDGFQARAIRNRPPKRFLFSSFSAASVRRWFLNELLPPEGPDPVSRARFLLLAGFPGDALPLADVLPSEEASLAARIRREKEAADLLASVRELERRAAGDPAVDLRLKRLIEDLIGRYRDTLVFLTNSDGSTWIFARPGTDL